MTEKDMKSNKRYIQKLSRLTLALVIGLFTTFSLQGQVRKTFTPRTGGVNPPSNGIYNLRGDFTMIGNTNMSLTTNLSSSHNNNDNNSNATMNFVKVDPNMVNSSTAALTFYQDSEVNAACSEIVYAGLYWTGRAHNTTNSSMSFGVGGNTNERGSSSNSFNGYTLSITQSGSSTRTTTYTFTPTNNGSAVVFTFTSNGTTVNSLTVKVGSNPTTTIPSSEYAISSGSSGNSGWLEVELNMPFEITTGSQNILINSLRKRRENNSINSSYHYASVTSGSYKILDKRKVKIKGPGASTYTDVTAEIGRAHV